MPWSCSYGRRIEHCEFESQHWKQDVYFYIFAVKLCSKKTKSKSVRGREWSKSRVYDFQERCLDWFPRLRAISLAVEDVEGEQNKWRTLHNQVGQQVKLCVPPMPSVEPDVIPKSSPIFTRSCPKNCHSSFYLKRPAFKLAQKSPKFWVYFWTNICHKELFKNCPIWSHWLGFTLDIN